MNYRVTSNWYWRSWVQYHKERKRTYNVSIKILFIKAYSGYQYNLSVQILFKYENSSTCIAEEEKHSIIHVNKEDISRLKQRLYFTIWIIHLSKNRFPFANPGKGRGGLGEILYFDLWTAMYRQKQHKIMMHRQRLSRRVTLSNRNIS